MRTQFTHDEIAGTVEDDIADVEERQSSRHLLRREMQNVLERVVLCAVHCLSQAHITLDGRAQEV